MAETIAEAYMREGRVEEARAAVRGILETRFGTSSETLAREIDATTDLTRLQEAICRAALARTLEEFQFPAVTAQTSTLNEFQL